MAAPALRRLTRWIGWMALGLLGLIAAFALAGWIGSSIPRNANWREPANGVTIMVETNGVHTALVLPLVTPERDWRPIFPDSEIAAPSPDYTHLAITVPYAAYELSRRQIAAHAGTLTYETFAADVSLEVRLPSAQAAPLADALREATAGQARVETLAAPPASGG